MKRIICLSLLFLLLTLNVAAEERRLQAAVPGEAGTIALRVTLEEGSPAVLRNDSGISPEPKPSALPEPATLGLLGPGRRGGCWRPVCVKNNSTRIGLIGLIFADVFVFLSQRHGEHGEGAMRTDTHVRSATPLCLCVFVVTTCVPAQTRILQAIEHGAIPLRSLWAL